MCGAFPVAAAAAAMGAWHAAKSAPIIPASTPEDVSSPVFMVGTCVGYTFSCEYCGSLAVGHRCDSCGAPRRKRKETQP